MLYKQGKQTIEIIVKKDASVGLVGTNGLNTEQAQLPNTDMNQQKDVSAGIKQKTISKLIGVGALQLGKQVAFSGFDYYVSGINMMTGDQALQSQINRKIEVIQDVVNIGTSTLSGIVVGSSLGVVGAVVGGVIGAASASISIGFRQAERERSYNYETFKTNNEIQYQRARAELSLTTGRVR